MLQGNDANGNFSIKPTSTFVDAILTRKLTKEVVDTVKFFGEPVYYDGCIVVELAYQEACLSKRTKPKRVALVPEREDLLFDCSATKNAILKQSALKCAPTLPFSILPVEDQNTILAVQQGILQKLHPELALSPSSRMLEINSTYPRHPFNLTHCLGKDAPAIPMESRKPLDTFPHADSVPSAAGSFSGTCVPRFFDAPRAEKGRELQELSAASPVLACPQSMTLGKLLSVSKQNHSQTLVCPQACSSFPCNKMTASEPVYGGGTDVFIEDRFQFRVSHSRARRLLVAMHIDCEKERKMQMSQAAVASQRAGGVSGSVSYAPAPKKRDGGFAGGHPGVAAGVSSPGFGAPAAAALPQNYPRGYGVAGQQPVLGGGAQLQGRACMDVKPQKTGVPRAYSPPNGVTVSSGARGAAAVQPRTAGNGRGAVVERQQVYVQGGGVIGRYSMAGAGYEYGAGYTGIGGGARQEYAQRPSMGASMYDRVTAASQTFEQGGGYSQGQQPASVQLKRRSPTLPQGYSPSMAQMYQPPQTSPQIQLQRQQFQRQQLGVSQPLRPSQQPSQQQQYQLHLQQQQLQRQQQVQQIQRQQQMQQQQQQQLQKQPFQRQQIQQAQLLQQQQRANYQRELSQQYPQQYNRYVAASPAGVLATSRGQPYVALQSNEAQMLQQQERSYSSPAISGAGYPPQANYYQQQAQMRASMRPPQGFPQVRSASFVGNAQAAPPQQYQYKQQ